MDLIIIETVTVPKDSQFAALFEEFALGCSVRVNEADCCEFASFV